MRARVRDTIAYDLWDDEFTALWAKLADSIKHRLGRLSQLEELFEQFPFCMFPLSGGICGVTAEEHAGYFGSGEHFFRRLNTWNEMEQLKS